MDLETLANLIAVWLNDRDDIADAQATLADENVWEVAVTTQGGQQFDLALTTPDA